MQHFKKASACCCFFLGHNIFCDNSLFFFEASHKMSFLPQESCLILAFSFLHVFINFSCTMHMLFSRDASHPVGRHQLGGECCKVEYPTRQGLFTRGSDSFVVFSLAPVDRLSLCTCYLASMQVSRPVCRCHFRWWTKWPLVSIQVGKWLIFYHSIFAPVVESV